MMRNSYSNMGQDNHVLVFVHHYKSIFSHQLLMVLNRLVYVVDDPFYMKYLCNQSMVTNQKIHYLKSGISQDSFSLRNEIKPGGTITPKGD